MRSGDFGGLTNVDSVYATTGLSGIIRMELMDALGLMDTARKVSVYTPAKLTCQQEPKSRPSRLIITSGRKAISTYIQLAGVIHRMPTLRDTPRPT